MTRSMDQEVARFHETPIVDDLLYLLLDGVYLRVKRAAGVRRRLVLCAYGIMMTGERRLLDFRLAPAESAVHWEAFLNQLRQRGLYGRTPSPAIPIGSRNLRPRKRWPAPLRGR